jgi:predicted peptidase
MVFGSKIFSAWGLFIQLFCLCITLSLFAAEEPKDANHPKFTTGQEIRIDVNDRNIGGGYFRVYVPSDYNDKHHWPVIFYFHGAGSKPSTKLFRTNTAGKGFIIVGLENVEQIKGQLTRRQYINYLNRELRNLLAVKRYISKYLKIDRGRLFITGKSMGGWLVSALAERSARNWAGIAIFCAGRNSIVLRGSKTALRDKPIYIGTGENDQNRPAAEKAAAYYRRLGAKVTIDVYPGLGHKADPESKTLYNWLCENSSTEDTEPKKENKGKSEEPIK